LDELVEDPGYLLAADRAQLLATGLGAVTTPNARTAADAYRRAVPALRRHPPSEGAGYLGLEARCGRAPALAEGIISDDLDGSDHARHYSAIRTAFFG
jgi:hypothetical protein